MNEFSCNITINHLPPHFDGMTVEQLKELGMQIEDSIPDCAIYKFKTNTFDYIKLDFTVNDDKI